MASIILSLAMLNYFKKENKNILDVLFEVYERYGAWHEKLITIDLKGQNRDLSFVKESLEKIKSLKSLGSSKILNVLDYENPSRENFPEDLKHIQKSSVVQLMLENQTKITLRPSGTEPILKAYISVCEDHKNSSALENYKKAVHKVESLAKDLSSLIV
jgi:phosphoglucomutase